MTPDLRDVETAQTGRARLLGDVPRSLDDQHRTEVVIQRVRYAAWVLCIGLTIALQGGPGGRFWFVTALVGASVALVEVLIRRPPTATRLRIVGIGSFSLDTMATAVTLLTVIQDPADPVVFLATILALEAAVRWQITGAVVGALVGVPISVVWQFLAHAEATGGRPPLEYSVFHATILTLIVVLVGAVVQRAERERHRAEEVLRHTPELIVTLDETGRITSVNPAAVELLGQAPEDLIGQRWDDLLDAATPVEVDRLVQPGTGLVHQAHRRADGTITWLEVSARDDEVQATRILVARDVTTRVQADRDLAVSEQRLRALFTNNLDAVFGFDIDGRIIEANPAAEGLFRRDHADLLTLHSLDLVAPSHRDEARVALGEALGGASVHVEVVLVTPEGTMVHADTDLIPIVVDAEVVGVFGMARDVTERKRREAYLEYRATHDLLTGLPNRAALLQVARHHLEAGVTVGLLFLDLDGFKDINDRLGHAAGDEVLVTVARRLQAAVREHDLLARLAGDEFCILLSPTDPVQVQAVGDRAGRSLVEPLVVDGSEVHVGVSVGAALSRPGEDIDRLMARADAAMYTVKEHRRVADPGDPSPSVLLAR